jgi:UDP-N-acetylglucosamine 2-epimerase (non-hydrolysing)
MIPRRIEDARNMGSRKKASPIRVDLIAGARPNFMKISALWEEFRVRPQFAPRVIHTGQHFSPEMSKSFIDDLALPEPHVHLNVGLGSATEQTASILLGLEGEWKALPPNLVVVVGDVSSTAAAALAAVRASIPLAHVEAGLRSFDRSMPEENNRILTDALSDYLFASEPSGVENLRREGVAEERIFLVGNVMIDTLLRFRKRLVQEVVLARLGLDAKSYALATLHRASNVDSRESLQSLIGVLTRLSDFLPVVFPAHPRTRASIETFGIDVSSLLVTPPLGYIDFLSVMSEARFVLTDSGGVQDETSVLGVPCLTLRNNTERPITISQGTNRLVGVDPLRIMAAASEILDGSYAAPSNPPEGWDGKAASRIADVLIRGW